MIYSNDPIRNPKQSKKNRALVVLGVIVGFIIVVNIIGALLGSKESPEAREATTRNFFVSECKAGAVDGTSNDPETYSYVCGCTYDKLQARYGGKFAQEQKRIVSSGYTQEETDLIQSCL